MDKLNVKSLNQALESLKTSWNKYNEVHGDEFVIDSVIHWFKYTYALAVKYIHCQFIFYVLQYQSTECVHEKFSV